MKIETPNIISNTTGMKAEGPFSATGSYAEEIRSNADVVGNLNSKYLYDIESEGPYQEMSKGASLNKYLEKIAMSALAGNIKNTVVNSSTLAKVGLGVSSASLGISAANYHNGRVTAKASMDKANLERKSLTALNNINRTLSTSTIAPSPVAIKKVF